MERREKQIWGHDVMLLIAPRSVLIDMTSLTVDNYLRVLNLFLGHSTDEQFVKYVEDNPILWDNRCQDYKDCKEKALVWDSVGNACGITGEQARLKWVSLREKYRREKLYWENIEKNGNSSNTPLKELWPLMKKMKFIDAVSTRRQWVFLCLWKSHSSNLTDPRI